MSITKFDHNKTTAKSRYEALQSERRAYTDRAEKCSKYTLPQVFPKSTDSYTTNYDTPYQSLGARGVNNLAAKLSNALIPPNMPFFRLSLGQDVLAVITSPDAKQKWEQALVVMENDVYKYMENSLQLRATANEAFIQLIVAGNCLLYLPPKEGGIKLYRLDNYVCQRDGTGNVIELIAVDHLAAGSLPQEAQSLLKADVKSEDKVDVYTHVYLEDAKFNSYQEVEGNVINGSMNSYPIEKTPWIPLRLRKMDGESYGRSYVDEYLGDLVSLESLSKSIVQIAAVSANIVFLVAPTGMTKASELQKAKTGDFIKGRPEDVQAFQINKSNDLQVVSGEIAQLKADLSFSFLLNSAVQRDGERVTATEIQYLARELENTIGSIYSVLANEFQLPLVRCVLNQMISKGMIKDLPQGAKGIEPIVTTGIAALGRGAELQKLDTFLQYAQVFPEAFDQAVKKNSILKQLAISLRIDPDDVIKTDEEIAQEQLQQATVQAAQQGLGTAIGNVGGQQQ